MIEVTYAGPTGGDETAPYYVLMDRKYTVREFIEEILQNRGKDEWGRFKITDNGMSWNPNNHDRSYGYKQGKMESPIRDIDTKKYIVKASASGGWSNMDYLLTVSDNPNEKFINRI